MPDQNTGSVHRSVHAYTVGRIRGVSRCRVKHVAVYGWGEIRTRDTVSRAHAFQAPCLYKVYASNVRTDCGSVRTPDRPTSIVWAPPECTPKAYTRRIQRARVTRATMGGR